MIVRVFKPFIFLGILVLLVGVACNIGSTDAPLEPAAEPVAQSPESENSESGTSSGAANSLQDVKSAVIQIEAQGSFVDPQVGWVQNNAGAGSGFIIDPSGIAITNNHVVTGAALIKVRIAEETEWRNARILGVSECSDLAVIDIDGDGFSYLDWFDGNIATGLPIYAAGFPLGDIEYTLLQGIISKEKANGESTWSSIDHAVEHTASTNPGNSGGPIVTEDGKVVAVHFASNSNTGQRWAIGRDEALQVLDQLRSGNDVDSIGVNGTAVMSDDGSIAGIWVSSVASGSPANRAGLQGGDIIYQMEDLILATDGSMADYCDILRTHQPTDALSLTVLRFGTNEILEGQLNGPALTVVDTFGGSSGEASDGANETGSDTPTDTTDVVSGDFMAVTDNLEILYVEIPSWWNDIDGRMWESTWSTASGDIAFQAPNIIAAPNLDDYYNYWSAPGVDFSASADWGKIGGFVQLLDDAGYAWYVDECEKTGRYNYEDPKFEGRFDIWDCGVDADVIVLSARPIADPYAYLVLLQIQLGEDWGDSGGTLEDRISETFDILGTLP
jgi:serine protease Do